MTHKQVVRGGWWLIGHARTLFFVLNVLAMATARLSEMFDMLPGCKAPCSPFVADVRERPLASSETGHSCSTAGVDEP